MTQLQDWQRVASAKQLDPEYPIQVFVGAVELAVGLSGDEVFAVQNICTHAFARLSDGMVENGQIFCPLHQGSFDVRSGAAVASPCVTAIMAYPARIEGDDVFVDAAAIAAQAPTAS
jgi:nitrite reductase/ring-hydroxylating ferredoxin subunit